MRPIDELPEDAKLSLRQNAAMIWLVDSTGLEYRPPKWLCELLSQAEKWGAIQAQQEIRIALGVEDVFVNHAEAIARLAKLVETLGAQQQGANGPTGDCNSSCCCNAASQPTTVTVEIPSEIPGPENHA